jgi:N-acetylglucosaminyldiphosphoundecaprenol N-acetyl-beta-D-mannosaminyltransferase
MISEFKLDKYLKNEKLITIDPVGYLDSLKLQKYARIVMTDSGGIQEEACVLGVPCVTLRDNTERPETVEIGCNVLAGADTTKITEAVDKMIDIDRHWRNPFGDGIAAQKIVSIIRSRNSALLAEEFSRPRAKILGLEIDAFQTEFFVDLIKRYIDRGGFHLIITMNPEMAMSAQRDPELKKVVESADLVTADGVGIVIAGKILKAPIPERVTGIDLCYRIFEIANQQKNKIYLLGTTNNIISKAAEKIQTDFPNLQVVGYHHGFFTDEESEGIVNEINKSGAQIVLVGMGSPLQEKWIFKHRDQLKALCIGVGGSFDVLSGEIKRAPKWTQKLGVEWCYRTLQQPTRIKRVLLNLPVFVVKVVGQKLKKDRSNT